MNFSLKNLLVGKPSKKPKLDVSPIVFVRLKTNKSKNNEVVTLKALLDTGATASLIKNSFVQTSKIKSKNKTTWRTSTGQFHLCKDQVRIHHSRNA